MASLVQICAAQFDSTSSKPDTAVPRTYGPPIRTTDTLALISKRADTPGLRESKSPWLAVGLSAAAPGAGQIYNKNYWHVPVIWGLGGYWVYEWIHLNNNYKDYRDQFANSVTPTTPSGNGQYLLLRDFYRDERDKFAWYLGALYFLNLVDAYVGASLYDFDVSPDLGADGRVYPRVRGTLRVGF